MSEIIAITGGTGFVGSHLLKALVAAGYCVRVLARDPGKVDLKDDSVDIVEGDLENRTALTALCAGASAMVHCAGLIAARDRTEFDSVNVTGTRRVVETCVAEEVGKLVLISSLAAREPALSDYGASKRAGETVVRETGDTLSWSIIRPPAVYGPGDRGTLPLIRQLTRRLAVIPGSASSRISLIHAGDLAAAVVSMLRPDAPLKDIHEVHDGAIGGYSWKELVLAAGKANGRRVDCIFIPQFILSLLACVVVLAARMTGRVPWLTPGKVRELYHHDWVCSVKLIDEVTEWTPEIQFEAGFAGTVVWYREHGWL